MDNDLTSVFNRLSGTDRAKLKATAGLKALTDFIREDGEKYPWKNPFYAGYLVLLLIPIPMVPQATLLVAGTLAWAKFSKSEMAQDVRRRLEDAFTAASIMKEYGALVVPVEGKPESLQLRNFGLVMKATWDTWDTTCRVCAGTGRSIRDMFRWPGSRVEP